MKKFGVIRNTEKPASESIALEISGYLKERGCGCFISGNGSELHDDCECAIVLGGDGTLLRAAKKVLGRQLPLLGVNLGTLGYLAEIETRNLNSALDHLIRDEFTIEKRMMIKGTVFHGGEPVFTDTALNDISINRKKTLRTFVFHNYVNGELLNTYSADGMVVSTPTGSTGYNLSLGGPIVSPEAKILLLTPSAPHSLISRSIILPPEDRIRIEIGPGKTGSTLDAAAVSFDGSSGYSLGTGDSVEISTSDHFTSIIKINHVSFLDILRRKMADT